MRSIAINGRFLAQNVTGVQRYAIECLRSLDELLTRSEIVRVPTTVFVPANATVLPKYSFLKICKVGNLTDRLWEQFELPVAARGSLLFTPCGGAPVWFRPQVVTIHDAGPFQTPEAYTSHYRFYYKSLQKRIARLGAHIITVSDFSKHALAEVLRLDPSRISRIYLSGEHILRFAPNADGLGRYGLEQNRYVFAVGLNNLNKNYAGLIKASTLLATSPIKVTIAGKASGAAFWDNSVLHPVINHLGFVPDEDLRTLYENAACFVFPSFYEGFGLPPLEALTLGCPVIVSRSTSLPEIFGSAAVYCDASSPEDIASQILRVLRGDHPSRQLGVSHAFNFTWEKCARQTWEVLLREMHR